MEVRVHLDLPFELLPTDYVMMRVKLPDRLVTGPREAPADTVAAGEAWLRDATSAALRVPSVLVPHAWNVLLNPRHPGAARAQVAGIFLISQAAACDPRM